jgi:uncharacterized protein
LGAAAAASGAFSRGTTIANVDSLATGGAAPLPAAIPTFETGDLTGATPPHAMKQRLPLAGLLALPLAAGLALALGAVRTAAAPRTPRIELEVAGVLPLPEEWAIVLVLREKGAGTLLPVIVPGQDGKDLRKALAHGSAAEGTEAADSLLDRAIAALGAKVVEVQLDEAEETARAARVHIVQDGRDVELAASPSESIPLAVAVGAPIVTTRRVLDEAGVSRAELERLTEQGDEERKPLRL